MGFIQKVCNVLGGSSEFPTGDTNALKRSRAEVLLKKCAQCLIDCNVGWQLDTARCATMDSFINIPNLSSSYLDAPGLLFTNSLSGCKLLMFYEPNNMGTKNYNNTSSFDYNYGGGTYHSGLCISIIPAGSSSTFGDPSTNSFYPNDATRVVGTYYRNGSASDNAPAGYKPQSDVYYAYYILATSECVAIFSTHGSSAFTTNPAVPIYAVGKIFGMLTNSSDSTPQSKYGTIVFRVQNTGYEAWAYVINTTVSAYNNQDYTCIGWNRQTSNYCPICFTNAQGEWLNGVDTNSYRKNYYFPMNYTMLSPYQFNISGALAWCPISVQTTANDISNSGVITGNGLKGFLDTDLFRAISNCSAGLRFDNHKFYVPETNVGLAIGWDSSNDE